MTDQELLELAAKASGFESPSAVILADGTLKGLNVIDRGSMIHYWHPLADDGDALRLAVKLGLYIDNEQQASGCVTVSWGCDAGGEHLGSVEEVAPAGGDDCAATRRAIGRAAAEIGRAMP